MGLCLRHAYNAGRVTDKVFFCMSKAPSSYVARESALYLAAQTRAIDASAIASGVSGFTLMSRAARVVYELVSESFESTLPLFVVCGGGNNGGDGLLVAWLAKNRGREVQVCLSKSPEALKGDAARAYALCLEAGIEFVDLPDTPFDEDWLIVDALLGTGLNRDVQGDALRAIAWMNASAAPVVAVDVPSGLCSDTGRELGEAVKADITVTFIALKFGLFTGNGPDCAGFLHYADLEVADPVFAAHLPVAERLDLPALLANLDPRQANSHKGFYGHVLVVGGDYGFGGAVAMAAEAALSCGAGLVSVATRAEHVSAVLARTPEVMVHAVANRHELDNLLAGMSVVVIGPGLGQSPWSEQLLQVVLERDQPLVVDADALNILVTKQWLGRLAARTAPVVVTPHPGEAARMLGQTTAQVQGDRLAASRALQALIDGVVVLKGAGSLVSSNRGVGLSDFGNAGMASGGMGDVLSGVLGALLAQIPDAVFATELGVCLHGDAADLAAARFGLRGLRATQLMPYLQERLGG